MAQLDSMSFNYWYLAVEGAPTDPLRRRLEAAAAHRGVQLRTPTLQPIVPSDRLSSADRLTAGWDFRIEAEESSVSTIVEGRAVVDPVAGPSEEPNAVVSTGSGVIVRETSGSDLLWASFTDHLLPHRARVRFRLRWDGEAPATAQVARITAARLPRTQSPAAGNPVSTVLSARDFTSCPRPCYHEFTLDLDQTNESVEGGHRWRGDYFQFSVEQLGPGRVFVDFVHVDSEMARRVLAGDYDAAIIEYLRTGAYDTALFDGFSVKDEPRSFEMSSIGHLSDVVEGSLGRRSSTVVVGSHNEAFYDYYLETVRPPRLITDPYYLGALAYAPGTCSPYEPRGMLANPDFPSDQLRGIKPYRPDEYHADLQIQLDCLAAALERATGVAERHGVPYWYVVQAHGIFGQDSPSAPWTWRGLRQVSAAEARLITYLGVAYGAKAVIYHLYKTVMPGTNDVNVGIVANGHREGGAAIERANNHSDDYDHDLVRMNGEPDPVYTGYRRLWEAFRRVNGELARAGPTLVRLRHALTYNSSDGHPSASPISRIRDGGSDAEFVHVGVLEDPGTSAGYVVLVNRMARPTDERRLQVTLRESNQARTVTNVGTGEAVARLRAGQSSFTLEMAPGDGCILAIGR